MSTSARLDGVHGKAPWQYLRAVAIALALTVVAGCGSGTDASDSESETVTTDAGQDSQADAGSASDDTTGSGEGMDPEVGAEGETEEPDYEEDAGADLQNYEYPEDPEPAMEIVATLCNLNSEYFTSLRAESTNGDPVVNDSLRLSVLSMDDNLSLWEGLRSHYPELDDAIDTAWLVRDHWDTAVLNQDNGDEQAAGEAMLEADEAIGDLPETAGEEIECP